MSIPARHDRALSVILLLVTPALMASNMLAARWVGNALPPAGMAMGRWLFTLVLLLPWTAAALWRGRAELALHWRRHVVLGALGMVICGPTVYLGGHTTTATNIGLLYAATPIIIVLIERLAWGRQVPARTAAGIALCVAGVTAIMAKGDPARLLGLAFTPGDLWILLAVTGWALYTALLRHWPSALDVGPRLATIVAAGTLVLLPVFVAESLLARPTPLDARALAIMAFLGLVPGLAAFIAYGKLVALIGAGRTGMLLYLTPLYNVLLAYLLLGEQPALFHLAGTLLILPGIWLSVGGRSRGGRG